MVFHDALLPDPTLDKGEKKLRAAAATHPHAKKSEVSVERVSFCARKVMDGIIFCLPSTLRIALPPFEYKEIGGKLSLCE